MAKIEQFEDLQVWQKAREIAKVIYQQTQKEKLAKDFSLKDQMNRSAGSIMDNIAEGFERGGKKELIQFLFIAKGSSGELRSQLHRAFDKGYIIQEEFDDLVSKTLEIGKQLSGFIKYLKASELKGSKYTSNEPEIQAGDTSNFEL